jgi:hypothetical protein
MMRRVEGRGDDMIKKVQQKGTAVNGWTRRLLERKKI